MAINLSGRTVNTAPPVFNWASLGITNPVGGKLGANGQWFNYQVTGRDNQGRQTTTPLGPAPQTGPTYSGGATRDMPKSSFDNLRTTSPYYSTTPAPIPATPRYAGGGGLPQYEPQSWSPPGRIASNATPVQPTPSQTSWRPSGGPATGRQTIPPLDASRFQGEWLKGNNANAPTQSTGGMNISTSIQPHAVFGDDFMRQATNLAAAQGVPAMADLQKSFARPGLSTNSPAAQTGMGAQYGNQAAQGASNAAALQQLMAWANVNNNLAGQQARDQEGLGWAGNYAQGLQNQWGIQNQQQGDILSLLQRLLGGM